MTQTCQGARSTEYSGVSESLVRLVLPRTRPPVLKHQPAKEQCDAEVGDVDWRRPCAALQILQEGEAPSEENWSRDDPEVARLHAPILGGPPPYVLVREPGTERQHSEDVSEAVERTVEVDEDGNHENRDPSEVVSKDEATERETQRAPHAVDRSWLLHGRKMFRSRPVTVCC